MEMCSLVDADGRSLGRVVARGSKTGPGAYFPVVHLWLADESGNFLIQRRADHLASDPGMWATTAGYVQAGETPLEAVVREAREEMGLRLDGSVIRSIGDCLAEHRRQEVWLVRTRRADLGEITLGDEVSAFCWVMTETVSGMIERGEFAAYRYFERLIRPIFWLRSGDRSGAFD